MVLEFYEDPSHVSGSEGRGRAQRKMQLGPTFHRTSCAEQLPGGIK
jgi:hypothetical protein